MKVENPVALRFLLQDELYLLGTDKSLYEKTNTPEPVIEEIIPEIKTQAVNFNYLGQNLKNFLILVHYPELEFIAETHLTALENILKRKDLAINDVAILNIATYNTVKFDELIAFFKPAKLLLLGKNAQPQGIAPLTLNSPQVLDGRTTLYSFGFDEMMDSTDNKKAFWEQMKSL